MSLIFDSHAHYDSRSFEEDREEILSGLFEKGVGKVMDVSAAVRSIPLILQLADRYEFVYASAGLHPSEVYGNTGNAGDFLMCPADPEKAGDTSENSRVIGEVLNLYDTAETVTKDFTAGNREEQLLEACMAAPKVLAVGEIGLDYHYDELRKDVQKHWFALQIALARKYKKPVIIHSRDAAADTLDIMRAEKAEEAGGIVHCFSYSREIARECMDMGFYLGIGGVLTYKNAKRLKEVVSYMPMDRMVLETDCPYLTPEPYRNRRNDSSMLTYVADAAAQLKGLTPEEVITVTRENAERVYGC